MDVLLLTDEELKDELDAFYTFVRVCGQSYLSDEGNNRFTRLRYEWIRRSQEEPVRPGAIVRMRLSDSSFSFAGQKVKGSVFLGQEVKVLQVDGIGVWTRFYVATKLEEKAYPIWCTREAFDVIG